MAIEDLTNQLKQLKEQHAGPAVRDFEAELRTKLGPKVEH